MLDKLFLLNEVANIKTPFLGSISWTCKVHEEDEGFSKERVKGGGQGGERAGGDKIAFLKNKKIRGKLDNDMWQKRREGVGIKLNFLK